MHKQFLSFFQTSLQLSWMLFGGNHHTLLGAQMNIFQDMTSWLKVNNNILIKMNCLISFPSYDWIRNFLCGHTKGSVFGHPLCTMEQTRGIPSHLMRYPSSPMATGLFLGFEKSCCPLCADKPQQQQLQFKDLTGGFDVKVKGIWVWDIATITEHILVNPKYFYLQQSN